jgi:hypothetical protein
MMPPAAEFESVLGDKLGIGDDDTVVVYDSHGLFGAARAWYTLFAYGFHRHPTRLVSDARARSRMHIATSCRTFQTWHY